MMPSFPKLASINGQVGVLLEHTVGNLDPLYIVNIVPNGLEIPRLVLTEFFFFWLFSCIFPLLCSVEP